MTQPDQTTGTPDPSVLDADPLLDPTAVELERLQRHVADLEDASAEKDRLLLEAARAAEGQPLRYAVWDTKYLKYVGAVYDTKPNKTVLSALLKNDGSTTDDVSRLVVREV